MKKLTLLLLLTFVCFSNLYSQTVTLEKGKEFEVDTHTINNYDGITDDALYTFAFKVLGKEGVNTILDCQMVRAVTANLNAKSPMDDSGINTDSIRATKINTSWNLLLMALLQQHLVLTVSPRGELIKLTGTDDALQRIAGLWELKDNIMAQLKSNTTDFPKSVIANIFPALPEQAIGYQSEWTGRNLNYKATAINGPLLYLSISESKSQEGKDPVITGSGIFNQVTGLIEKLENVTTAKGEVNGAEKKAIIMTFAYKQNLRYGVGQHTLDTAWINMAAKTSTYFSTAFKTNMEFDSVKVFKYFKSHDASFANDPYYAVAKLDLINSLLKSDNYDLYGKQLRNTPTRLLKGEESHLFNKFNESLNTSADSAYEVSRYLYKTNTFNGLVQDSYSQTFLSFKLADLLDDADFKKYVTDKKLSDADVKKMVAEMNEKRVATVTNGNKLLSLLHEDKDPIMQQKINPLYLWVHAENRANDKAVLTKTLKAFVTMSDAEMKSGNGGRYALLFYKLLLTTPIKAKANGLLMETIKKLEQHTADTLYKDRYADQNLLAYAWYLKYQAEAPADSVKALQYLSKAARYSPMSSKEKAYVSFYDRVFLHSKESYRDEFIEKLFNAGDEEQALKVFADHVNSEPANIDEMQKIYESHFPGKKFKDFFAANIMSAWQIAPDFILAGLDGKQRKLSDFKKRWLVIDFWGTWCSPCRGEMPDINAFNKELKQGKYAGINFLSVACRDNPGNVKSYLAQNNFEIPAAMANETIERAYKIAGYPSKIIISPDGKMLTLKFGDDWAGTIKKFNDLYPIND